MFIIVKNKILVLPMFIISILLTLTLVLIFKD